MIVDTDSMSAEERNALLAKLASTEPADEPDKQPNQTKTVTVDGHEYTLDLKRMVSWKATDLMARMSDDSADDSTRFFAAIQFYNYVMGAGISKIVEACGGEEAVTQDVLDLATRILQAGQPKN